MAAALPLAARARRKLPRVWKFCRRWLARGAGDRVRPRAAFVLGAQRSGTRLPLLVMDRSPEIITYNEGSTPFFDGVLLKDNDTVRQALSRMPFRIVVLKPICESHRAVDLLDMFSGSKVIWIYRNFRDTVNSSVAKWTTGRSNLRKLAVRDFAAAKWRAGGLTAEKLELVARLYNDEMSLHAADSLMWYLRTSLFLDLGLANRPDVLLLKYEDLVVDPGGHFPRLFAFLGCSFQPDYLADVYSSSVRSHPFPGIPHEIEDLCECLAGRMDRCYAETLRHTAPRRSA